ncbi:hypothetical protein ACTHGU_16970 [Chitinophagaceae bacterium MMS25-I14]
MLLLHKRHISSLPVILHIAGLGELCPKGFGDIRVFSSDRLEWVNKYATVKRPWCKPNGA